MFRSPFRTGNNRHNNCFRLHTCPKKPITFLFILISSFALIIAIFPESISAEVTCYPGYFYDPSINTCTADPICPGGIYDHTASPRCIQTPDYSCRSTAYAIDMETLLCTKFPPDCPCGGTYNLEKGLCIAGMPPDCPCDYGGVDQGQAVCYRAPTCPDGGSIQGVSSLLEQCIKGITIDCPSGYFYSHSERICYTTGVTCPEGGSINPAYDACVAFIQCLPDEIKESICDGVYDNDCDGQTDEGCACEDLDNDGVTSCAQDCNDNDPDSNALAAEVCDGVDNNCDGKTDAFCTGKDDVCRMKPNTIPVGSAANVATGNLYHSQNIIQFRGEGASVSVTLSYNSMDTGIGSLGRGWTHTYNLSITEFGDAITHTEGDGKQIFYYNNNGVYSPDPSSGLHSTILKNDDDTFTHREKSGITSDYDTAGRLTTITDRNGNAVSFAYSANDLISITDASGRITSLTYNANKIQSMTDPAGRTTTYAYTGDYLDTITGPANDSWTFTYDNAGRMLTKTNPLGATTSYTYDSHGMLATATDSENNMKSISYNQAFNTATVTEKNGLQWTFVYDDLLNLPLQITDPYSTTTTYAYDSERNLTERIWADGRSESYAYDAAGNRIQHVNGEGRLARYTYNMYGQVLTTVYPDSVSTKYSYDGAGNLIKKEHINPAAAVLKVVTYTYGSRGERLSATDANNNTTTYTYDQYGNIASSTNAMNHTTTFTYDIMGNPLSLTDPNNNAVLFEYDLNDHLVKVTGPDGAAVHYEYDDGGSRTLMTDPGGNSTAYEYDSMKRAKKIIDPKGNSINFTYDAEGNITSMDIKDASETVFTSAAYSYDALNRIIRTTHSDSTFTERSYDVHGNILSEQDENGNVTTFTYDEMDRIRSRTDAANGMTSFTYNSRGNLLTITDAQTITTTYAYDYLGQLISEVSPDRGTTNYSYDNNGNMTEKRRENNGTIIYGYDALNRLTSREFPDSPQNITYTYDESHNKNSIGRLTSITDPSGSSRYDYDKYGRIIMETKEIDGLYYRTGYEYDASGNMKSLIHPNGRKLTYQYNGEINVTSVTDTLFNVSRPVANTITYLPFSAVDSMTQGNGTRTDMIYDSRFHLGAQSIGALKQFSYARDAVGNITALSDILDPGNAQSYGYDNLYRLTSASGPWGTISYAYDAAGNRTDEITDTESTVYSYGPGTNQLLVAAGEKALVFAYDSSGNTVAENTRQYLYDQNQRLLQVIDDGITAGEYVYDGFGKRVKKLTGNGNHCTLYHYSKDGLLIAESTGSGNITAEYVYSNGNPLAKIEGTAIYYYHNNHLGTPVLMTDGEGLVVWEGEYRPFGETYSLTGSITNNLRFPGQYYDAETGLHYNYFRDYHPVIGRYIEADPIALPGGINPYEYVEGNPVNKVDPLGLWAEDVHSGIGNNDYGTYTWALGMGFSKAAAKLIAIGNNAVDAGPGTSWFPIFGDQSRHFNQPYLSASSARDTRNYWAEIELQRALRYAREGDCEAAYGHLGKGLHSIQDKYAHREWDTGIFGARRHPEWYDDWDDQRNQQYAVDTRMATIQYLNKFLELTR